MAYDNRRTYLCYNNSDLIRDGYIKNKIEKEYEPVSTFNVSRLKNPPKGVSYVITRDNETREITAVKEVKKQLPASKIKIEIDFSKVMRNAVTHPFAPASFGLPMVNILATPMLSPLGMGGITSGLTYITVHLMDAETKFNRPIIVTKKMIETGIWECEDGYPLSVFGTVKDHYIEPEGEETEGRFTNGLDFDESEPLKNPIIIGKYSDGVWKGSRRKRISGATNNDGLFGSVGEPEIKFENVAYDDQQQLFVKIIRDERILKFRGDNYDASGGKDYPFRLSGVPCIDATNKQIKLKIIDDITGKPLLYEGDTIFITYSVALKRHVRQNLSHRGDIAQGNTIGIVGFRGSIKSIVDAWDYQIKEWKVPLLPSDIEMKNIDDIGNFYTKDDDYKLTLSQYLSIINSENEKDISGLCETIEGWRLSESITNGYVKKFWAADYRGILLYNDGNVEIVYPESEIRDKEWFKNYLESLDFIHPTGGKDDDGNEVYVTSDLRKKIDNINLDEEPGFLFDLTDISNSLLFDREKIPYYRPLANALKNINKYKNDDEESGIGVVLLDLIEVVKAPDSIKLTDINLELYDLSYVEFYNANAQPLKSYSCEDPFDIHSYNYWSESYDASTDAGGMGAWYDRGHIDNQVFEWRPSGGSIESYWKIETPYFCGEYSAKSRVYIEKMYGNSLDNYSWIFVDSDPFVPHNISSDAHHNFDEAIVVFNDDNMHYGLCYHKFVDSRLEYQNLSIEKDFNKSHIKELYDYNKDFMVGQNRMLGDFPSYSNGIPIVDDITRVCKDLKGDEFWFSKEIYDKASYGLNFEGDSPKANIPTDWFIRNLIIEFFVEDFNDLTNIERYISFYFEGTESSISDVKVLTHNPNSEGLIRIMIDFKYYYNGPLQFLGHFWKKIKIKSIMARYTTVSDSRNIDGLDIDNYKIKSGQNAAVYDGAGRLFVFHANSNTSNIDVALSYDDGNEWIIHKNLIRLIEGETTGMPFVISDKNASYVHLFYTLNDIFLMYKRINTDFFVNEDAFVEYTVPTSYDVDDYDQKKEKPEEDYWGHYSNKGKLLRQYPSYFIAGDHKDPYFVEQIRIKDALNADYINSPKSDVRQVFRFDFSGNKNEMKDSFRGDAYSVYMDDEGVLRLFMLSDGKLSIKRSNNYFSWKYDVEKQIIHKDFIDDKLNKGMPEGIQNIQIVRNNYTESLVSVLYFHNGMLFIRHFHSDLLLPFYNSNGEINNENMKKHLEITKDTKNKPIFLVGKIPKSIKDVKIKEIDNEVSDLDSDLFIYFPYNKNMLEKFDERFEIDVNTQVYAYTLKNGLIRIFYKDIFGNLNGIILDALRISTLEVMNKFKDK